MIEVYVLLTLGTLGYLFNKTNNNVKKPNNNNNININEIPSMKNIYESNYYDKTNQTLKSKANKKYQDSFNPKKTNNISYNYQLIRDSDLDNIENTKVKSVLSGNYIDSSDFHNNMVPFYGGSIKQNIDDKTNRVLLENFTGVNDIKKNKCEVGSFFNPVKNLTNINGSVNNNDFILNRITSPTSRNNDFPIPQIQVGPGLGQGYNSKPTGGFQQTDLLDFAQPRNVDELRTRLNPDTNALGVSDITKKTYDGRIIDGMKAKLPGKVCKVNKNRVETFFEKNEDMLFKTTGANLKPTKWGKFDAKETNRITTTKEIIGSVYANGQLARKKDPNVKVSVKQQLKGDYFGIAALDSLGVGNKYDYGKSQILVYNNERDITSTKVYQGNVISLIKSIIAPIEDMIKITKKQHDIDNPRHFGNMNAQIPKKQTVYDPNDVARTTIKETNVHDAILGNLKGSEKQTVYDPNDVARTTIKETNIHDGMGGGTITGAKQLYVYDPDDVANTTIRETVNNVDYHLNIVPKTYNSTVYETDDIARKTTKETTVDLFREYGNIDSLAKGGAYETNEYDAKDTQKQFLSDNDYYGTANKNSGLGYQTNEYNAKDTHKQFLSDNDYYGHAGSTQDKKQMSYEDVYNATIDEKKEQVIFGREPTQTGAKEFNDCIYMAEPKKKECDYYTERKELNFDRIYNNIPSLDDDTITKMRKNIEYDPDNRFIDTSLLDALKTNPYVKSFNSVT